MPQLNFLDLSSNLLTEINQIPEKTNLKVMMLGKNKISQIDHLQMFPNLDMLDLHENQLANSLSLRDHFGFLKQLRVLNLSNNQLTEFQFNDSLQQLKELNLRNNRIKKLELMAATELKALQKLYLSNNLIGSLACFQEGVTAKVMPALQDLTLENNPLSEVKEAEFKARFSMLSDATVSKILSLIKSPSEKLKEKESQKANMGTGLAPTDLKPDSKPTETPSKQ